MQSTGVRASLAPVVLAVFIGLVPSFAGAAPSRAETLLRQGRVVEALALADKEAAERPGDVAAHELVLDIMLSAGDQAVAERRITQLVEADPENPDWHYLLGRARIDTGTSRAAYEVALRLKPDHARAHMGMGSLHEALASSGGVNQRRLVDAEAAYARAVKYDPTLGEAWFGRVRALTRMGRHADALSAARDGVQRAPDEPGLSLLLAQLHPEGAVAVLERAVQSQGEVPELHEALAIALLDRGDAQGAHEHAGRALALNPSLPRAQLARAYAHEVKAGALPQNVLLQLQQARALESTEPAAALAKYSSLVRKAPKSAMVLMGRASAHRASGDREAELVDLVASAKLAPDNHEIASLAGGALARAGRHGDAVPLLTRALAARPADPVRGLALARSLQAAGFQADAKALMSRVASGHPADVDLQLAYIQLLADQRAFAEAYGAAKVAMQVRPDVRLVAAFVKVAPLAGRAAEAAAVLEPMAEKSGSAELRAIVNRLRSQ